MYDLVVIGAGWAGISACMEARSRGMKCALIEKGALGGTCLNTGCIPTKALIQSAKIFSTAKKAASFGVSLQAPEIVFSQVQERKNKIIAQLRNGINAMLTGVDIIQAQARVLGPDRVQAGNAEYKTKWILAATGSVPVQLKDLPFDGTSVLSSDQILALTDIPRSLLIVGGGVIGCEFASLFACLGARVTIVELMAQLLPGMDADIASKLAVCFKKKRIDVKTSCDVRTIDRSGFEKTLVCVGRKPFAADLGLEAAGAVVQANGASAVNDMMQTGVPSIYAAGDCTGGIMLAHYAAFQGRGAVSAMAGAFTAASAPCGPVVPSCVFTDPEIACTGLSEERARQLGMSIRPYRFDFMGSGMARILDETEGYVKILAEEQTGRIVGGSIIGPRATELIGTITVAAQSGMTVEQLRNTILPHPTLSESITEALHG
ncbi:MAG TPA: dihydrolipoyl dehydrogenase [Candidatus Omnitrophota bacterium]|nr:dihydrolipoyl dehydrogenase [Candidatus Omnitrophota bacterium]HNQ51141.1 dihydrolipoyl dehydrogenase [Candidatus Omnitrophota bacterium]HQO38022.1 dihydrolipoyl dehydrogenase [Candidatus Omnitrophota bacterium]HQQ06010.1 dihydrolipoyl dehydrogenase [Candidatus Omnitrophota bacterium]